MYERLGGEGSLRQLVKSFYVYMDTLDDAKGIRKLHAKNLRIAEEKLFMFLSGLFGGPNLYIEKHGHPRLRRRHLPFAIGKDEAEQWLNCMHKALDDLSLDIDVKQDMLQYFTQTAYHMINQSDNEADQINILK
jgi:hemoglobin